MPHDERMLKSAYKQQSRHIAHGGLIANHSNSRRNGYSQTAVFMGNKSYDTRHDPSNMSPDMDQAEKKFERSQRRWEMVLDKKQANMESKREELKQMLAKKWKREKTVVERDRDNKDWKTHQQAERREKFLGKQ